MAATNIFYRIPSQRGTRIASIAGTECTLEQFCKYIIEAEGLSEHDFIIASGTKVFRPSSCSLQSVSLQNNSNVDILIPLLGGKGGFGSLLRAIGAQIEKTTNRDACRDLSGRRLRDIKREEELKRLIELRERLIEERRLRKREKLEKLRKRSEKTKESASIQELVAMFDDHAFNQRRMKLSEILDAAVERGLINSRKRQLDEGQRPDDSRVKPNPEKRPRGGLEDNEKTSCANGQTESSSAGSDQTSMPSNEGPAGLSCVPPARTKCKKGPTKSHDLWLGLDDEDLEGVSEEEEQEQQQQREHQAEAVQ